MLAGVSKYMSAAKDTDVQFPADNQPPAAPRPDAAQSVVRAPGDHRNVSLALLATIAVVIALYFGSSVFIPVMLAVLLTYALSPVVDLLHKWKIPRVVGAALVLLGIVGGTGSLAYSLSDDLTELIETLPEAARNFRQALRTEGVTSPSAVGQMQKAASELERAARESGVQSPGTTSSGATRVQIEKPRLNVSDYLWSGALGAAALAGQTVIVLFLVYFLLISGDTFRRKLVTITGPAFSKKKITIQVLDEINSQIQRYLLVQISISTLVGIASWIAFRWLGLEHAAIWAIAAGVLNLIPYLGAVIVIAGSAIVALLQFGTLSMALLIGGVSLLIRILEGMLLTPWLTGRAGRMNPVVVFVGVLFWGWLWGVSGLLLGVPIIMIIKAICDHVEDLKPIGELLGD
ncbi:MAG: AI-2E family transporter [Steroidobacteraceae bacterium]